MNSLTKNEPVMNVTLPLVIESWLHRRYIDMPYPRLCAYWAHFHFNDIYHNFVCTFLFFLRRKQNQNTCEFSEKKLQKLRKNQIIHGIRPTADVKWIIYI